MKPTSYFFRTFFALLLATVTFLLFKKVLPKKLFPESNAVSKNVVVDSLLLEAVTEAELEIRDSVSTNIKKAKINFEATDGVVFPSEEYENYKGNQYLIPFYEKLFQMETNPNGKARVAYFGDSMTDGDMIVKDFRRYLQEKFGGNGVGFVNITSESASSRSSLVHEFSYNWKSQSYLKSKHPLAPFGVNGHVFFTPDSVNTTWVRYKANKTKFASSLHEPILFYGKSNNKNGEVFYVANGDTIVRKVRPNQLLNTLQISESNIPSLKLYFKNTDSIPFYGFNFDDGKGIHVDNFSSRGNSGLPISVFSKEMMNAFQKQLNYDLIVLHYGTNVLNYGSLNYLWYEKRMQKVVEHLKECFPEVTILIVSTADKATKYDLEMKTDSAVVPLSSAQKRYAIASKSGFVNLYQLMGGDGSMVKWVEEEPAKANKDYTHFNFRGANVVGEMIFNQLMDGYSEYKKLRLKRKIKKGTKIDTINIEKDSLYVE